MRDDEPTGSNGGVGGEPPRRRSIRLSLPLVMVLLWVAVGASYGNSLTGDFSWDDRFLILDSPYTKDFKYLPRIFTTDFRDLGEVADRFRSFYRPVVVTSYLVDYHLWGLDSTGFHLTNFLLHVAASMLVFGVVLRLVGDRWIATATGLLFAVHPCHVESVSWISGRTDLFSAVFLLASLLVYLVVRDHESRRARLAGWGASLGLFGLALFSREMALTLPALIALVEVCETERPFDPAGLVPLAKRVVTRMAPFVLVLVVYLAWRSHVLGRMHVNPMQLDLFGLILSIAHVTARYLQVLIFPLWLDVHRPDAPVRGLGDVRAWTGLAAVAAGIAATVFAYRRSREAFFGAAWAWLTIVPVYNIGSFGDVILAERLLYLPSAGFLLAVVVGIAGLARRTGSPRRVATVAVVGLALLYGGRTFVRNQIWATEVALFESAVRTSPESGYVRSNLGFAYAAEGRYEEAAREMELSIEYVPLSSLSWSNYGVILERLGRLDEALAAHSRSLELEPRDPRTHFNRGNTLRALGRLEEALRAYDSAIALNPDYGLAYTNLGETLLRMGRDRDAEAAFRAALGIDHSLGKAHNNLGKAHNNLGGLMLRAGRLEAARRAFQTALGLEPTSAPTARNLGEVSFKLGDLDTAEEAFRLASRLDPGLAAAQVGLARTLLARGERFEAIAVLKLVAGRRPDSETVALLLSDALVAEGDVEGARRVLGNALAVRPTPRLQTALEDLPGGA